MRLSKTRMSLCIRCLIRVFIAHMKLHPCSSKMHSGKILIRLCELCACWSESSLSARPKERFLTLRLTGFVLWTFILMPSFLELCKTCHFYHIIWEMRKILTIKHTTLNNILLTNSVVYICIYKIRPWWLSWMCVRLVIRRLRVQHPPIRQHSCVEIDH